MATFRLHRFSSPETLKRITPRYFFDFLRPYESYLQGRGVVIGSDLDYEQLVKVLMTPDETFPKDLADDLYFVHEMASTNGMDELLDAIEDMPAEDRVIIDTVDATPADVAIQVRLQAPEILERKHAEHRLTSKRSFEYYQTADGTGRRFPTPGPELMVQLKNTLDDRLDLLKRGRTSKVFFFPRDEGVWILVRHGQPYRREGSVTGEETDSVYYRPEYYDVLRYDPVTGDLAMNAETVKIGKLYREKFGLFLFNDTNYWPGVGKYTLEPLVARGRDALVCTDIEGMEWVVLKELHIFWGGANNDTEIRKGNDVLATFEARQRPIPKADRLRRASFQVKFKDSKTPRTVAVSPSNIASYTRDDDALIVESWLAKRGFIRVPVVEDEEIDAALEDA